MLPRSKQCKTTLGKQRYSVKLPLKMRCFQGDRPLTFLEGKLSTLKPAVLKMLSLIVFSASYYDVPASADLVYSPTPLFARSGYDYAPSIIRNGNLRQYWWCGLSTNNIPGQTRRGDVILYRTYNTSTGMWSFITQVLTPTTGTWDGENTCDPSVVQGSFSYNGTTYGYAMYYTALNTLVPTTHPAYTQFNHIGVAFSNRV